MAYCKLKNHKVSLVGINLTNHSQAPKYYCSSKSANMCGGRIENFLMPAPLEKFSNRGHSPACCSPELYVEGTGESSNLGHLSLVIARSIATKQSHHVLTARQRHNRSALLSQNRQSSD